MQGPEVKKQCQGSRAYKPSKQTSQCLSTGENCPRSNFCFVWSWPKNRFPSHSALPPSLLTSLPSSLPPSPGICGNCACPQLPVSKYYQESLPTVISYHYPERLRRPTCLKTLCQPWKDLAASLSSLQHFWKEWFELLRKD